MKIQPIPQILTILVALALPILASAANISMTAVDSGGDSSLLNAGKWSNGQPPSAANDYFSGPFYIRTPTGTTNITFAGHSLTLQSPDVAGSSGQVAPARSILFKGGGGSVTIINNLTNSGGIINAGSGNVLAIFGGNQMFVVSNSTIQADQGPIQIDYPLAGSADLTNTSGQGRTITYTGTNSAFTGRFVINNNVTVAFNSRSNVPGNPVVSMPDQFLIGDGCTLQDNAGITYNNANGGITLAGNVSITAGTPTTNTIIAVPITDNGGGFVLTRRGGGIVTISGNNTFGGGLSMAAFTVGAQLNINSTTAVGTGLFTLLGGAVAPAILDNTSGSQITLANNNSQTWNNSFLFIGSSSLNMGSGTVTMYTNITATISNNNLTVGPLADDGLSRTLIKSGPGTLTVNGGAYFTGTTTISNGVLALTGSGLLSATNITLASSTATLDMTGVGGLTMNPSQTLAGKGTVSGAVSDGSSTIILPGGNNVAGTLTINGNLTLNGAGAMAFDLASTNTPGGGTNDLIVVTGTLNIAGPTAINVVGSPASGSPYTLIQYGTFAGSLANLSTPPGFVVTNNTGTSAIQIIKVHIPANLTWQGDGAANVWDVSTTADWIQSGTNQVFFSGDSVLFNNTGSSSPAINLSGLISPATTTVNSSQNYDFIGNGILTGSLAKSGGGTLILENDNSYTGDTTINGGVLQVGNGGSSGSLGSGPVTNNASLQFNRFDAVVVPNNISGTGSITFSGTGDLSLSGSNSYAGSTTITSSGILHPKNANALGSATAGLTNINGGKLYVDVNVDFPNEPLTLGGGTALEKGGGGTSTLGGAVTLVSDTTFSVDGGATLNLTNASGVNGSSVNANVTFTGGGAGNIVGPLALGSGSLTVSGGTWTVAPTNNYGLTTINSGTLLITGSRSLGQPPVSFNASQVTLNGGTLGAATNVTINDGKIGITLNASASITVVSNSTLTISNDIGGSASLTLTKTGLGQLVLNGANDFSGTLNVDSGSTSANDGTTVIANNAAIANILVVPGVPFINIRNNNGGSSTLALDGTQGSITVAPDIGMFGRNVPIQSIENIAGNNTISGNITLNVGGIYYEIQSDSGILTLSAPLPYATPGSARLFTFLGAGSVTASGGIQDASGGVVSVLKTDTGTLNLPAANSYTGTTVVSNGTLNLTGSIGANTVTVAGGLLLGNGSIAGSVAVQSAGALEAGATNAIGTLTLANTLTLAGNTIVKINKSGASNDQFSGASSVMYGGTLTVTNLAGTLTTNDTFTLFSPGASASNFAGITGSPGAGLKYTFTNGVLGVAVDLAGNPTNIMFSVSGNTLSLSWPTDHLGWILQSQTNNLAVGISTNWADVTGSASVTGTNVTINPANPSVFYRLRHP